MKFLIKQSPLDEGTVIESRYYRIEHGGALVLWSGSLFEPVLVRAFAPWAWMTVESVPEPAE